MNTSANGSTSRMRVLTLMTLCCLAAVTFSSCKVRSSASKAKDAGYGSPSISDSEERADARIARIARWRDNKEKCSYSSSKLKTGERLYAQVLCSPSSRWQFAFYRDQLIVFSLVSPDERANWNRNVIYLKSFARGFLQMQEDCNLVLYGETEKEVRWNSGTAGRGTKCEVRLQNDGNLVIYEGPEDNAVPVWSSLLGLVPPTPKEE